ncbi:hypothetical protein ACH40E_03005 [Streptomyces acidicola]|uniref:hypothetical protein n=1 Tax=Streptomyces acidicola TaxID=2596892 RepID=UPI00378C39CF
MHRIASALLSLDLAASVPHVKLAEPDVREGVNGAVWAWLVAFHITASSDDLALFIFDDHGLCNDWMLGSGVGRPGEYPSQGYRGVAEAAGLTYRLIE